MFFHGYLTTLTLPVLGTKQLLGPDATPSAGYLVAKAAAPLMWHSCFSARKEKYRQSGWLAQNCWHLEALWTCLTAFKVEPT